MESKQKPLQSEPQPLGVPNVETLHCEIQWALEMEEHLAITARARELFNARGGQEGHDREDWLRAESELHLKE